MKKLLAFMMSILMIFSTATLLSSCVDSNYKKNTERSATSEKEEGFDDLEGSPEITVAEEYIKAGYEGDFKRSDSFLILGGEDFYISLAEDSNMELGEFFKNRYGVNANNYDQYCEISSDYRRALNKNTFGDNIKLVFKDKNSKKLSVSELDQATKRYETYNSFIDIEQITEAYRVKIIFEIFGSEKSREQTESYLVLKYKDEYKIAGN